MDQRIAEAAPRWRVAQFHWGAVFAGAFVALGVWVLLYTFALAIGLSSIDVSNPRSVGLGTGIGSLVAPLIALFIGGLVAGRVAGPTDRAVGMTHGFVMWGLTTVAGVIAVGMLVSALVAGVVNAGGSLAQVAGQVAQAGQGGTGGGGLSADDLLGPLNNKLRSEGKPPVTASQLQNALTNTLRQGSFDRDSFVRSLSQSTNLTRQDAQDLADRVQSQLTALAQKVPAGAAQAARASGKAFWGLFFALLLGLIASLGGAAAGVTRKQQIQAAAVP